MPTAMHALGRYKHKDLRTKSPNGNISYHIPWVVGNVLPPGLDLIGEPLRNHVEDKNKAVFATYATTLPARTSQSLSRT